jgi:protein arginine N-methyltransferase 1
VSVIVEEHRDYLGDPVRIEAFRAAVREVVGVGDVVVDLGCGTGILGLFACEAGARRVYAIEVGGIIEVARALAQANGVADRMSFVRGHSTRVALPEPGDVLVADQIGPLGFEAGLLAYYADARQRLLRPRARLIPHSIAMIVAPVEAADEYANIAFWSKRPAGFDFSPVARWATNTAYPVSFSDHDLLAPGQVIEQIDLACRGAVPFRSQTVLRVERAGTLHGIGGWFEARLSPSISMTNAPSSQNRISRRNAFLPIEFPVKVEPGDEVSIALHVDPVETMLTWEVTIAHAGRAPVSFRQSTLRGMLLTRDDLRRMRPDYRPELTRHGAARRTVLQLCDGIRPLQQIESEVFARHPDLFRSVAEASALVAEVVARDTD